MTAINDSIRGVVSELNVARSDAQHGNVQYYFDTADVRRAVLGAQEYILHQDADTLDVDIVEFGKPPVLAACLIAAGFIGPFAMLPPHQAELLRQLNSDQAFSRYSRRPDDTRFLKQVGIGDPWGAGGPENLNDSAIRKFLRRYAGRKTQTFFKAVQCIRKPWWEQLKSMRAEGRFLPFGETIDYVALEQNDDLTRIVSAFQRKRGKYQHEHPVSKNNLADAVSLLMLTELTRDYRSGRSKKVPRFYDSTGIFLDVAQDVGLLGDLTVGSGADKSSVLVTTDYLVYRSSLVSASAEGKIYEQLMSNVSTGRHSRREISELDSQIGDRAGAFGKQLQELIDLSFLKNVWLSTLAASDLREVSRKWAAEEVLTDRFKTSVAHTIEATAKDVLKGATEYKRFSGIWLKLRKEVKDWRARILPQLQDWDGAVTELMLFRLSPPDEAVRRVRETLAELADEVVEDGKEFTGKSAWHALVSCCVNLATGRRHNLGQAALADAEYVALALWAMKAETLAFDLLKDLASTGESFLVSTIAAASALRTGRDVTWAARTIERLDAQLSDLEVKGKTAGLNWQLLTWSSTIAYLWFHLWLSRNDIGAWWRVPGADPDKPIDDEHVDDLHKAIRRTELAWSCTRGRDSSEIVDKQRILYVVNQRLYYLAELGSEARLQEMKVLQAQMAGYRTNARHIWLSTYADTIARYFAFRAFCCRHADEAWSDFMAKCKENFNDVGASAHEPEVRAFGDYLVTAPHDRAESRSVRPELAGTAAGTAAK